MGRLRQESVWFNFWNMNNSETRTWLDVEWNAALTTAGRKPDRDVDVVGYDTTGYDMAAHLAHADDKWTGRRKNEQISSEVGVSANHAEQRVS